METLQGAVRNLRHTIEVEGGGHNTSSTTKHIAVFDLNGAPVRLAASEPIILNQGEIVIVAGERSGGVFQAYAYYNQTRQVYGQDAYRLHLLLGPVVVAVGILAPMQFVESGATVSALNLVVVLPLLVGGVFVLAGLYTIYCGWRVKRAVSVLQSVVR